MTRSRSILPAALIILLVAVALRVYALPTLPPGLHFDEATNGILARQIAFEGYRPLFIESFGGKEPIWFYAAGLITWLTRADVFSLRLASTLIAVISVAAAGWSVGRLYADHPRWRWIALFSMAVMATAFWHVLISRIAFRAITQPLLQALSLGFLWWGLWSSEQEPHTKKVFILLALAGVFTGLAAYTYLAVRLFPIPLALALLTLLAFDPARLKRLRDLLIFGTTAVVSFAPLGCYFLNNPERFFVRYEQVAPSSGAQLLEGWRIAIKMLFLHGDPVTRLNYPGKPLMGPIMAVLFLLGLIVLVRDTIWQKAPLDRARNILLILWLPTMLAPNALSVEGIIPSNLRAIGLWPLFGVYPALALLVLADGVGGWQALKRIKPYLLPGALALILIGGGISTQVTMTDWGHRPDLYVQNDAHTVAMGEYLNAQQAEGTALYAATFHYQHPSLIYMLDHDMQFDSLYTGDVLVVAPHGDTLIAYARDALPPQGWQDDLRPYLDAAPVAPDGEVDFISYRLPNGFDLNTLGIMPVVEQTFGGVLTLTGAQAAHAPSGTDVPVDLAFRVEAAPDDSELVVVVELCDAEGWCWNRTTLNGEILRGQSQSDRSSQWTPGEQILLHMEAPLSIGAPPAEYEVRVGVFSLTTGQTLPVSTAGQGAAAYASAGTIGIAPNPDVDLDSVPMANRPAADMGSGITLVGYDFPARTYRPGSAPFMTLYWGIDAPVTGALPLILMLDDGTRFYEGPPAYAYATDEWMPGELIAGRHFGRLPADLPGGTYDITAQIGGGPLVSLGEIEVEGLARSFEPPANFPLLNDPVELGDIVTMIGVDAPGIITAGEPLEVQIGWQALAAFEADYTVFLHLINESGEIVAQVDRPPMLAGEPYPTTLWAPDEVVIDAFQLTLPADLPPGSYRLRLGLYRPSDGVRLTSPGYPDGAMIAPITLTIQ